MVRQENGSRITNFTYVSHCIFEGKRSIEPLPATYVEEEKEASTIEITLHDDVNWPWQEKRIRKKAARYMVSALCTAEAF
jgi:hypothetical protein